MWSQILDPCMRRLEDMMIAKLSVGGEFMLITSTASVRTY